MKLIKVGALLVLGVLLVAGAALGLQLALLQSPMPGPAVSLASNPAPGARLTTIAEFPVGTFLEDLAVRDDGSMLITDLAKKQLWYMPAPTGAEEVQPLLLHTFDQPPFDIVETQKDLFYIDTASYLTSHESFLQRVDLRGWHPGMPVPVQSVLKFPFPISAANGEAALSPNVILVADAMV
ncbi:MAG TPA: hypothetical protein VHO95_04530, partial [Candidatus Dormibacteraeota bacterium]|nr:hypothetical protein [Candidatus Dormibacteraeota bacterium]